MRAPHRLPAPPQGEPLEDHFVHFHGVSWEGYERVLEMRGDRGGPRIAYVDGVLEIMSPSISHESVKCNIGRLVEVWMDERGLEYRSLGSWTVRERAEERGAEPDECYVLGEALEAPERPDLVIEVVWTAGGIDKLGIYASLKVPEVWLWERGKISVHVLRGKKYAATPRSEALSGIDLVLLASFLDRTSTSAAKREYRAALRASG